MDANAKGPRHDSPTTRREFVKSSLLACASGVVVAQSLPSPAVAAQPPPNPASPAPPQGGYPVIRYGSAEPILLSDLERCQPSSALARSWQLNHWKLIPYEAEGVSGTLLTAGQNSGVPEVEYPISQRGWFAVSFGLMSKYAESRLEVRLKSEATFSLLTHHNMAEARLERRDIELGAHLFTSRHFDELFWKYIHFENPDEAIVLRQMKVQIVSGDPDAAGNRFLPCWLGYIRLVPLTASEVDALLADRRARASRRLFAHNDAYGSTSWLRFRTEGDIRREIEPFRDTDFSRMYWEAAMGDLAYFPSKVGSLYTLEWMRDQYRLRDRLAGESYADFRARGIDPFRVALDCCHEIGLEFHAAYRVAGFYFPAPEDEWNQTGLYHRHPEWRAVDRQGRPVPRLSYAYPGVREFALKLLRETAAYPIDGVCLLYNRRLPLLGYEAPLVESFQRKFSLDPKTLPETDPRWLAHCAEVLTGFMQDLRSMLRDEQRRQQRRRPFAVTAVVMSSRDENYGYGLDLERWVKEGLVDTLIPYSSAAGISSDQVSWEDPKSAEFFIRITTGTQCQLALNLMPRQSTAEDYMRRAHALYTSGVENLFFWDCYQRNNFDAGWTALTRLGHREELAEWAKRGRPPVARVRRTVLKIGDWDLSYGTPG